MSETLFWLSLAWGSYILFWKTLRLESVKTGLLLLPFFLLTAAAVARYLGI